MSEYKEFFAQDFANRCRDLLETFWDPARVRDREVTLLLAVASAGLVIPYERLSNQADQPRLDRRQRHEAIASLTTHLQGSLADSPLMGPTGTTLWKAGLLESAEGMPDSWPQFANRCELPAETQISVLVIWLRHGLAHGNISICPTKSQEIAELVFTCGYAKPHGKALKQPLRFVSVPPLELKRFLQAWFSLLASLELPRGLVAQLLEGQEAA